VTGGAVDRVVGAGVLVLAACAPLVFSNYWVSALLTQTLLLGIVASSLVFLSAYAGMISLAQVALFGISGFVYGNAVTNGNTKGLNLDWSPWVAIPLALVFATLIALLFGAIASRNIGIYFLMITLTFGVIANLFFGQVTTFSGFGGISGIPAPGFIGDTDAHPFRLYYVALVVAIVVYVLLRFVLRTPFGVALQGVRDDPLRMSSLGYNVPLHRTLAFGLAGFVAALGGLLFVWWNGHIDPASIDLGAMVDVLVIAVIGGLYRLEAAWLGAFVFVILNNYSQQIGFVGPRFHTLIGVVFLAIVLVSPEGLIGLWERLLRAFSRSKPPREGTVELPPASG
jgi:branched-chain amino acid transport system permease protein